MTSALRVFRYILLFFLVHALCLNMLARADEDVFAKIRAGTHRFELSNGLRVIFYKREVAPIFTGQIWVRVGGVDESPGTTGIAHFLEHMAFKGTKKIGTKNFSQEKPLLNELELLMKNPSGSSQSKIKEIYEQLRELWVDNEFSRIYKSRGGVGLNAGTAKDYTYYTVALPNIALELWCWMESERLLDPVFRQFYEEREVVKEERRSRVDDNPGGKLYESMLLNSITHHPYRLPLIGWKSDLDNVHPSSLREFYWRYYRPDNMVIGLVGDLEVSRVKELLERYFGRIPRAEGALSKILAKEPEPIGQRSLQITFDAQPRLMISYPKPTYPNPDDAYFSLVHSVLSEGRSSVLHKELVQKKRLASGIYTSEAPGELFDNVFFVGAVPLNKVSNEKLTEEIQKIFDRYRDELISENALASAKRKVRVGLLHGLASNSGLLRILAKSELLWNDWQAAFKFYDRVTQATNEDVRNVFRRYLSRDKRSLAYLERASVENK